MSLPLTRKIIEERDIFVPDLDDRSWTDFLVEIGAFELAYASEEQYEAVLSVAGKNHKYKIYDFSREVTRASGKYIGGYILRFKNAKDKLEFLIKWG
jgi:hypothetical protein